MQKKESYLSMERTEGNKDLWGSEGRRSFRRRGRRRTKKRQNKGGKVRPKGGVKATQLEDQEKGYPTGLG